VIESPIDTDDAALRALVEQLSLDEKVRLMTRVPLRASLLDPAPLGAERGRSLMF